MSDISKAYESKSVEAKWYQFWLDQNCFAADPTRVSEKRAAYSIVIPPPNVTGMLHMGHVLNNTIQDILARKARMDGKEVLWLPGTDHAGIATEGMVEKQIRREEKKTKREVGREEFLKRVWDWKEKHGGIIIEQLKKLGASCDWTRERFTMDEHYVRCVQKVFVELYKKGLIYRGKRMVNWCPKSLTALSDEEVDMEPQQGFLWYFRVEVAESANPSGSGREFTQTPPPKDQSRLTSAATGMEEGRKTFGPVTDDQGRTWLTIATTRPETIPGDTGIAVNPKDPRYAHLIGKHVIRPLPPELRPEKKLIPIVADERIDIEFGTGVLKVTPAHDKADFEIGQRHGLPAVDIMNPDATMNELAGEDLRGMDRFDARKTAVDKLKALGALMKEEPYENKVGFSQRAKVPIEPRLSEQWFLKYPSVEQSRACVANGAMKFHPDRWAKVYDHWLANIQDWCISRQLWWGHRIPVWRAIIPLDKEDRSTDQQAVVIAPVLVAGLFHAGKGFYHCLSGVDGHLTHFTCSEIPEGGKVSAVAATDSPLEAKELERFGFTQDPDVLDTWFSSWLWPFATMGWTGDESQDSHNPTLQAFYPTTDLVTGPDIIFFWVARMIMAGYEFMGDLPFRNVYFTGIIRDKQGRKMSKTLGNSPDPLELIAKYGADALRFGTMRSAPLGQDVLFDEKDVELGRNFCNKLWNACRFRQMQRGAAVPAASGDGQNDQGRRDVSVAFDVQGEINPTLLRNDDKWILLKLDQAIREMTDALANYKFNEATQTIYRFFWSEYCDWYVETTKPALQGADIARKANVLAVIDFILSHTLRLFHPFLPFITEELWHGMGYAQDMPDNQGGQTLMFAPWPKPFSADEREHFGLDECYLEFATAKFAVVTLGRNLRREANIPSNKKVKFILKPSRELPPNDIEVIRTLLNAEAFELMPNYQPSKGTLTTHSPLGELYLPLEGLIDVAAEAARLRKELGRIAADIGKVEAKLNNAGFVAKAPPQVIEENRRQLDELKARQSHTRKALDLLAGG